MTRGKLKCRRVEPGDIWAARRFIDQNLTEELSLAKVAKVVNLSANYLSEKFKQVTGLNFGEYVAGKRVEKARDMLRNSDLTITRIAFECGFQSLSQFNRVFKKVTGR